jgi:hypothetical protein
MEMDDNNTPTEQGDYVEVYSKRAVFWFSVLADPLFGGALLIINLWLAGYKRAVAQVALFLIVYETVVTKTQSWYTGYYKVDLTVVDGNSLVFVLMSKGFQIAGAIILTSYFYKKYFPDDDYYPRSIITPLLVIVFIVMLLAYKGITF